MYCNACSGVKYPLTKHQLSLEVLGPVFVKSLEFLYLAIDCSDYSAIHRFLDSRRQISSSDPS